MAKSMTGFGRNQEIRNNREITVEIKSVNSRYFEYASRLPRSLNFLDDSLKKKVSGVVNRGKCELHLSVQTLDGGEVDVKANLPVARGYYEALAKISADLRIGNAVDASDFIRIPDVFTVERCEQDEDEISGDVLAVAEKALALYDEMREAEGGRLCSDVLSRLDALETMVGQVEEGSAGRVQRYAGKLLERLKEVLADTTIDEARIVTEAAIFADKTAVDEETVRLRSHLTQYRDIIQEGGAIGRKLDFLTQELNREVNTIGSKCQEVDITRLVVDMKAEIEKIREQIQNLE